MKLKHRSGESGENWRNLESGYTPTHLSGSVRSPPHHTRSDAAAHPQVVTRFFTEVNLLTAMAELEAAKLKDYDEQYKYMKKVKKFQTTVRPARHVPENTCKAERPA